MTPSPGHPRQLPSSYGGNRGNEAIEPVSAKPHQQQQDWKTDNRGDDPLYQRRHADFPLRSEGTSGFNASELAPPLAVGIERLLDLYFIEVGPERRGAVELGIGSLPQQEI